MVSSSLGTTMKKAMERAPWTVLEGSWKTSSVRKVKSGFVTIDSPFEFHQAIVKFVPLIKSVYLPDTEWAREHRTGIQKDSRNPQGTSCGKVWSERGIWLKVFLPSRGWATFLYPMVFKREGCCHLRARNCRCWWQPLCFVPWRVSTKKRRVDTVSGIVSAVVSRTVLFQLVYYLDYFY